MPQQHPNPTDVERALIYADAAALSMLLREDPTTAGTVVGDLPPLLLLLRRSTGTPSQVRDCARLLLEAGADPSSHTVEWGGQGRRSALFDAVERLDLDLVRLLLERGAHGDADAFYHACEQSDTAFLDLLHQPGFEDLVNHKLDFEDAPGLGWFLDRGVDVNRHHCLHHAIGRGRGLRIITMLLDAGADVNLPWDRWDIGRRPLALAARCGHLAAYDLLTERARWTAPCGVYATTEPTTATTPQPCRPSSMPTHPPGTPGRPATPLSTPCSPLTARTPSPMRSHPIHAAFYDTMTAPLERQVLGPRRTTLLAKLTGQVLDVGAGTGANLAHLRQTAHIVAVEPDTAMRRKLAQRAVGAHVAVDVSDAAAEALPFPDEQFDAVLFTLVLCTVSDPERALAEAHRVLKPAGQLVVIEHVRGTGRLARWQDKITPMWRHLVPGCHPNRDTRANVQQAGFRWTDIEDFQPMPTWIPVSPMLQGIAVKDRARRIPTLK